MERFIWQPGAGIDAAALSRLRSHFRRPNEPMGEAWFMSEKRRLFHELEGNLADVPMPDLKDAFFEIASGMGSFGPRPEWSSWYHYLLGQLIPRGHDCYLSSLLESLVTGFIAVYPNGVHSAPYRQFLDDSLVTLGQCMMEPHCWTGTNIIVGEILQRSNDNPNQVWVWWDASGDLSASMYFCLKYLPGPLVPGWLHSVLNIPSPHWRAQVMAWLVGSHDLLTGKRNWPFEFLLKDRPRVDWESSHCLSLGLAAAGPDFDPEQRSMLPDASRLQTLQVVRSHFTDDVFLDWLSSISSVPYLEAELAEIPSTFEGLYVRKNPAESLVVRV